MGFPAANPDADAEEPALLLSEEWGRIKVPIEDRLFGENRNRALDGHVIQSHTGSNRKRGRDWSHYRSIGQENDNTERDPGGHQQSISNTLGAVLPVRRGMRGAVVGSQWWHWTAARIF